MNTCKVEASDPRLLHVFHLHKKTIAAILHSQQKQQSNQLIISNLHYTYSFIYFGNNG